uniref:Interferon/interleukin receptor domain-containing protein n=1 Tax=Neogobius melanostomus TaxID=47308 RepID=A0A8C6TFD3_9GOBI
PFIVIFSGFIISADRLFPPVSQAGRLRWSPAEVDALHTVQVRRFEEDGWSDLPDCTQTKTNSLRVRAQSGRERSEAVEACAAAEDRCTSASRLSWLRPGSASITVHLLRGHTLWEEIGDHAEQRVCYWREDRPEDRSCRVSLSSVTLSELDPNQTYCVTVQYLYWTQPEGLPRCPMCLGSGVTLPLLVLALCFFIAYVLIFHRKRLKTWLRPEQEPGWLTLSVRGAAVCTPEEEECDVITGFTQINQD